MKESVHGSKTISPLKYVCQILDQRHQTVSSKQYFQPKLMPRHHFFLIQLLKVYHILKHQTFPQVIEQNLGTEKPEGKPELFCKLLDWRAWKQGQALLLLPGSRVDLTDLQIEDVSHGHKTFLVGKNVDGRPWLRTQSSAGTRVSCMDDFEYATPRRSHLQGTLECKTFHKLKPDSVSDVR